MKETVKKLMFLRHEFEDLRFNALKKPEKWMACVEQETLEAWIERIKLIEKEISTLAK